MNEDKLHQKIRKMILDQIEAENLHHNHARELSIRIFNKTKNYLAERTVTHFLKGEALSGMSPFVLNSLAQFLDFESWNDFVAWDKTFQPETE